MATMNMIEIDGLTRTFGSVTAVDNLSLSVPRGQLFCLLGPNGAGKTTTIKVLTGLIRPTRGTARIGGFDVQASPLEAKRITGYVPDMPFLYDRLTAREFFEFTGDLYDIPAERMAAEQERLFGMFGLHEHGNRLVKDLSHGMKHRLIYASTFLHDPQVLFIDEPLTGLDPHTIRLMKDFLVERARGGVTILVTTHILSLAEDIADRIGIIAKGRLIQDGAPEALREAVGGRDLEEVFLKLTSGPGQ